MVSTGMGRRAASLLLRPGRAGLGSFCNGFLQIHRRHTSRPWNAFCGGWSPLEALVREAQTPMGPWYRQLSRRIPHATEADLPSADQLQQAILKAFHFK